MEHFCRLALGGFATPIVAGGGGDVGVAGQALDGGDVGPGVEKVAYHGAAEVVGGEGGDPSLGGALAHGLANSLVGNTPNGYLAGLIDGAEERARARPTHAEPGVYGGAGGLGGVGGARRVALAGAHFEDPRFGLVVG